MNEFPEHVHTNFHLIASKQYYVHPLKPYVTETPPFIPPLAICPDVTCIVDTHMLQTIVGQLPGIKHKHAHVTSHHTSPNSR